MSALRGTYLVLALSDEIVLDFFNLYLLGRVSFFVSTDLKLSHAAFNAGKFREVSLDLLGVFEEALSLPLA